MEVVSAPDTSIVNKLEALVLNPCEGREALNIGMGALIKQIRQHMEKSRIKIRLYNN